MIPEHRLSKGRKACSILQTQVIGAMGFEGHPRGYTCPKQFRNATLAWLWGGKCQTKGYCTLTHREPAYWLCHNLSSQWFTWVCQNGTCGGLHTDAFIPEPHHAGVHLASLLQAQFFHMRNEQGDSGSLPRSSPALTCWEAMV